MTKSRTKNPTGKSAAALAQQTSEWLVAEASHYGIPPEELTGSLLMLVEDADQAAAAAEAVGREASTYSASEDRDDLDGPMVVEISPEDIPAFMESSAGVNATGAICRPERYLDISMDFSVPAEVPDELLRASSQPHDQAELLAYLRGHRDACDFFYKIVRDGRHLDRDASTVPSVASTGGLWSLDITGVLRSSADGAGIRIAILDTGIDLGHPDLRGRITQSASFIDGETVDDVHGHGTHCAGTACGPRHPSVPPRYGAACGAELLVGKVLGNNGRARELSVLRGVRWAIQQGATIISMSLGGRVQRNAPADPIFEDVARRALAAGVLIVAAAGNDSRRNLGLVIPVSHPANCPSVLAVGSVGDQLTVSAFSNGGLNPAGGELNIVAPGENIYSALPVRLGRYGPNTGTSMATPLVAGIAAMHAQSQDAPRGRRLWDRLIETALPLREAPESVGTGLVQAPR